MRSVLDAAVDQIDAANRTPATKAKMAERILRAASDGITDPMTLTAIAIEDGMQPAD
jgi:phenylpyruvate tautomerase PptA (4-oxalocrotonate tautomerase family)